LHSAGWNKDWHKWVYEFKERHDRNPGIDDAKRFVEELKKCPKYANILDRGFKAGWSYTTWIDKVGKVKQAIGASLARQLADATAKVGAKRGGKAIAGGIPILSIVISAWDHPARAKEFGTGPAIGMFILDQIPIADFALAGTETIDAIQQERLRVACEAKQAEATSIDKLLKEAKDAGASCGGNR